MNRYKFLQLKSSLMRISRNRGFSSESFIKYLERRIKISGPLTLAAYMKEALTNPHYGYYMKNDVFGTSGDFTTSPEINQMFGEMVGIWFLNEWIQAERPSKVNLVELGPGRGTLMSDILRVFNQFKPIKSGLSVHLVEVSEKMESLQSSLICDVPSPRKDGQPSKSRCGVPISWHKKIEDVPKGFTFYLAHEFFDALPVHLLKKTDRGWREVLVDTDSSGLRFVLAPGKSMLSDLFIPKETSLETYEICPDASVVMEEMSRTLSNHRGSGLIIDYGHDHPSENSLRSFKNHEVESNILKEPGSVDITANVDFSLLKRTAASHAQTYGPVTQGEFLSRMGIETRFQVLLKNASPKQASDLKSAYEYLTSGSKMGDIFKVLSLNSKGSPRPAAF